MFDSGSIQASSADDIQRKIYLAMSPIQKWEQVCELRKAAWSLKRAAVRLRHPDFSSDEIEREVRRVFLYAVS